MSEISSHGAMIGFFLLVLLGLSTTPIGVALRQIKDVWSSLFLQRKDWSR